MIFGLHDEPIEVALSKVLTDAAERIRVKMAAGQLGEAWVGLVPATGDATAGRDIAGRSIP